MRFEIKNEEEVTQSIDMPIEVTLKSTALGNVSFMYRRKGQWCPLVVLTHSGELHRANLPLDTPFQVMESKQYDSMHPILPRLIKIAR